jgi:uncharacterized protein (DUF2252 family)
VTAPTDFGPAVTGQIRHLSVDERAERGRRAREAVPRRSLGAWAPEPARTDPAAVLAAQEVTRVPELVPIRHERMLASPFAFYRGAAAVMARDLAASPSTGLEVQACGDAHLANFGGFSAPDRRMIFDINDFDETSTGPFEWDVKRLCASFAIAAAANGFDGPLQDDIARHAAQKYRETMREFAQMRNLDVWYARLDVDLLIERWGDQVSGKDVDRFRASVTKARGKDSLRAFAKLTAEIDGDVRIVEDPPLIVRLESLAGTVAPEILAQWLHERFREYRASLEPDRRHLLESYELVDIARKVVGVGSVGTRCWIVLMRGRDAGDPLFMQIKEAEASVLEPSQGGTGSGNHGRRVVEGQRLLQAASDVLLGWFRVASPDDGVHRDFYVRQLWDGKLSPAIERMTPASMQIYAEMCGWTLARGHARSGDRVAIAAYLGSGDAFDRALADFALAYAEQNQRDFESVTKTFATGAG